MPQQTFIVGVGMTPFTKPGSTDDDYPDLAEAAIADALNDAGFHPVDADEPAPAGKPTVQDIGLVTAGYVFGDTTAGQRAVYEAIGFSGVGVINVNNACATGSTALYTAHKLVEGGAFDCILAVGFEKMQKGALAAGQNDRAVPQERHVGNMVELRGMTKAPMMPQVFGGAGAEYAEKHAKTMDPDLFAKVAAKNHKNGARNPLSQYRKVRTVDEVKNSKKISDPLTILMCSPPSNGAAAAIVCNKDFVLKHKLQAKAIEVLGMSLKTDGPDTFDDDNKTMKGTVGYGIIQRAAADVYAQAKIGPKDIDVLEVHDCFAPMEVLIYEALGLCGEGGASDFVNNDPKFHNVNPSGGLESKGHPLGATGIAQCRELCLQLRGEAGERQIKGAKIGLQQNLGLGSACVIGAYKKAFASNL